MAYRKFKVGDRVKYHEPVGYDRREVPPCLATVRHVNAWDDCLGLEFDEDVTGHDGLGDFDGKDGHCWFVTNLAAVEFIDEPKVPEETEFEVKPVTVVYCPSRSSFTETELVALRLCQSFGYSYAARVGGVLDFFVADPKFQYAFLISDVLNKE